MEASSFIFPGSNSQVVLVDTRAVVLVLVDTWAVVLVTAVVLVSLGASVMC